MTQGAAKPSGAACSDTTATAPCACGHAVSSVRGFTVTQPPSVMPVAVELGSAYEEALRRYLATPDESALKVVRDHSRQRRTKAAGSYVAANEASGPGQSTPSAAHGLQRQARSLHRR